MVKYKVNYEKGIVKKTLNINEIVFDYSMIPNEFGAKSDKKGFFYQLKDFFGSFTDEESVEEACDLLEYATDEEKVFDGIEKLEEEFNEDDE